MDPVSAIPTYLFVIPWALESVGGVSQVVLNLARAMAESGEFRPLVLIVDWEAVSPAWGESFGVRTVRWRVHPASEARTLKAKASWRFWKWRFQPRFQRFCRDERVAVINLHYPGETAFSLEKIVDALKIDVRFILSFHGADLVSIADMSRDVVLRWRGLLVRHQVVGVSTDLARRIGLLFGAEVDTRVIHNGLDANAFTAGASAPHEPRRRIILNVAKFEEKKGQDVLIAAFRDIAFAYPDVDLVLIGGTDAAFPVLRALSSHLKLQQRINFYQDVPHQEIFRHYRDATIFAMPSRQEPFGIALLEAGAFGLPVVASRVGGIPEIITHGENGLLVEPEDSHALANALRLMLDSPAQAALLGSRLRADVANKFTWASAYRKYVDLVHRKRKSAAPVGRY